MSKELLKEPG